MEVISSPQVDSTFQLVIKFSLEKKDETMSINNDLSQEINNINNE